MAKRIRQLGMAAIAAATIACGGNSVERADVAQGYADLVLVAYDESIAGAESLLTAIEAFVADPTDAGMESARSAWLEARSVYGRTEAFRFYDGPIDDADDGPEGQINAWPMDEAYVDGVAGATDSGIVNDLEGYPEITRAVLVEANEVGGETNISTGWHAIEFLLWGQDLVVGEPGDRPVADFTTAANADRRSTYLVEAAELLVDDLVSVRDQWAEDGSYRSQFLSDANVAIEHMMRGIGALAAGELAGERMAVAYETRDQEDEHSCFSDNTNADVLANVEGIRLVYLGDGGPSLSDLVAAENADLDAAITSAIEDTIADVRNFPASFEEMIAAADGSPERDAFLATLESVEAIGVDIARAANALGLTITIDV